MAILKGWRTLAFLPAGGRHRRRRGHGLGLPDSRRPGERLDAARHLAGHRLAARHHHDPGGEERTMSDGYDDKHWHLDRRVPIALIITIIMQTIGIVWWATSLSARVETLEHRFAELGTYQARIVRLEEKQNAVYQRLDRIEAIQRRIEAKIDRLLLGRRNGGAQ